MNGPNVKMYMYQCNLPGLVIQQGVGEAGGVLCSGRRNEAVWVEADGELEDGKSIKLEICN